MKKRSGFNIMMRLVGLIRPLLGYMILAIVMGLIGHLCASFITVSGGYAALDIIGVETPFSLGTIFAAVCIFALLRGGLRYAEQMCNHYIAFKLLALIRDHVFRALRRLAPAKLEGRDKGDLISVITSDIELLEVFYAHTISPTAIAILFTIIMAVFTGSFHPVFAVITVIAHLLVGLAMPLLISKLSGDAGAKFREGSGHLSGFVLDSLRGVSETIQFGGGEKRLAEMHRRTGELSSAEEHMKVTSGKNTAMTNTVILILDFIMLFTAITLYQTGAVEFDGIVIPVIAIMSSFGPAVALANLGSTLQNTFAAGNRVLDILDEKPLVAEIEGKDEIEFSGAGAENVTFAYGDEIILKDLTMNIEKGKVIGIRGRSGSGKSTFLKLLMRFWSVQGGKVTVSGTDVEEINTVNLRQMESFVTQETQLFHDSIRNNIAIAKLDADDEEIHEACRKASIHDFIMSLPQGYNTKVGELGDTLSGGERQRIGMARAFLHDAPLMLLDEPTSNLDSLNEAVILKSVAEEHDNKTVVLVSHRESTMKIADEVYSVENGRVS